jgi:hypothetical protein
MKAKTQGLDVQTAAFKPLGYLSGAAKYQFAGVFSVKAATPQWRLKA